MNTKKNKSKFQFSTPTILESIFVENVNYKDGLSTVKNITFKLSSHSTEPQSISDTDTSRLSSVVALTLETNNDLNFTESDPCYLRVTMKATFIWDKEAYTQSEVKSLLKVNAPSLLLSYIRPQVASVTENSDMPAQQIPFIDFSDRIDN